MLFVTFPLAFVAAAPIVPGPHPATDVFLEACVDGRVNNEKWGLKPIMHKQLPPVLRKRYMGKAGDQFFEITKPTRAYLFLIKPLKYYDEGLRYICGISAPQMNLLETYIAVRKAIAGTTWESRSPSRKTVALVHRDYERGFELWGNQQVADYATVQVDHWTPEYHRQQQARARRKILRKGNK